MLLLASAVAVLHALAVVVMLTGALLALRWPRLLPLHAPVAVAILAVNLAGADCPLTIWSWHCGRRQTHRPTTTASWAGLVAMRRWRRVPLSRGRA